MKMKKYISIILNAVMLVALASCNNFLDEKVYTQVTTDFITSTPAGMASAVVAMYEKDREIFRNNGDTETTLWMNLMLGDDVSYGRAGTGVPQFSKYTMLPSTSSVGDLWKQEYAMVGYANLVIAAAAKVNMNDPVAIQALSEARVFRAQAYFWLLRKFDRIYLTTRVTTPENVNDTIVYKPAEPDSVYKLINSDLDYAIQHLSWTTSQPGRFTQGAARHIKAQVASWQQNWREVANQVQAIAKSGVYSLLTNAGDVFNGGDLNHSEAILVSQWSKGAGGWFVSSGGTTTGHRMPLIFAPTYNKEAGMLIDYASGGYPWGRVFPNTYLLNLYDKAKDKRYGAWYKVAWTYNNPDALPYGKKLGDTVVVNNAAQYLNLHPASTKYNDSWTRASANETQSFKDIIIYRLAETYLLGAEAYYHLGKADSCAYFYNKTWVRAGNAAVATGAVTLNMITDENARELSFEGSNRWFYLKRNGLLIDQVKHYGGEYLKKGNVVLINDTVVRSNIKSYHVRLPIPQSQIDQMGAANFPQNPGY
jgi:hypothetical protein